MSFFVINQKKSTTIFVICNQKFHYHACLDTSIKNSNLMCQPLVKECRAVNLKCCVAGGDFMSNRHLYNRVSFLVSSSSNNRSQLRTVKYRNDIGQSHLLFNMNSDPISYPISAFVEMKSFYMIEN